MIKNIITFFIFFFINYSLNAQKEWRIGGSVGRAYFDYEFIDYGNGAYNLPSANYGFKAEISLTKQVDESIILESGLRFILYEQYYNTRLYYVPNEGSYPILYIPAYVGYKLANSRFSFTPKAGLLAGFMLQSNDIKFYAMHSPDLIINDSVSRGMMYRSYTPFFPMLSLELDASYQILPYLEGVIKLSGAKGFIKIVEFDIYYNDGSGVNDQRAKQWSYGDYVALSLGFRLTLNKKKPGL